MVCSPDSLRRARLLRAAIMLHGPVEPTGADWDSWVRQAQDGRSIPLLHTVLESGAGDLGEVERESAAFYLRETMAFAVRIEHELLHVTRLFDRHEIEFAVVKGVATAHLDYSNPSQRQFGDADLLVSREQFPVAVNALRGCGWQQAYPLPRYHERLTHAVTLVGRANVEIDLHQNIAHRAVGQMIPTTDLLRNKVSYEIAGQRLFALSAVDRLIHTALHLVTSQGDYRRLSTFADLLVMTEALVASPEAVLQRAQRWHLGTLTERGVRAAYAAAMLPLPDAWEHSFRGRSGDGDWLVDRAYVLDRRRPVLEQYAYLKHLRLADSLRYVAGHLVGPSSAKDRLGVEALLDRWAYLSSKVRGR